MINTSITHRNILISIVAVVHTVYIVNIFYEWPHVSKYFITAYDSPYYWNIILLAYNATGLGRAT